MQASCLFTIDFTVSATENCDCLNCLNGMTSNELNDQNNTQMYVTARKPPAKRLRLVQ